MRSEVDANEAPFIRQSGKHRKPKALGPFERDIAGRQYPYDITTETRDRWDLCVLHTVQTFYPCVQNPWDPVVAQMAASLFRTDLPTGPADDVQELLASVREAGGPIEYLAAEAEAQAATEAGTDG